jgi:hypothetical protein
MAGEGGLRSAGQQTCRSSFCCRCTHPTVTAVTPPTRRRLSTPGDGTRRLMFMSVFT